jgi:hypothetical protein
MELMKVSCLKEVKYHHPADLLEEIFGVNLVRALKTM